MHNFGALAESWQTEYQMLLQFSQYRNVRVASLALASFPIRFEDWLWLRTYWKVLFNCLVRVLVQPGHRHGQLPVELPSLRLAVTEVLELLTAPFCFNARSAWSIFYTKYSMPFFAGLAAAKREVWNWHTKRRHKDWSPHETGYCYSWWRVESLPLRHCRCGCRFSGKTP